MSDSPRKFEEYPEPDKPLHRAIPELWRDTAGKYQATRLGAHTAGLGLLGLLAGRLAAGPLSMRMGRAIGPQDKEAVKKKLGALGAVLGGAAGMYTGSRGLDFGNAESLMRSLFEAEYWKNNPDRASLRRMQRNRKSMDTKFGSRFGGGYDPMSDLSKSADDGGFSAFMPDIDLDDSRDLVLNDLYMDPVDKGRVDTILTSADEDEDSLISQFDLSKSALKSGLGFVPSYFAGSVFGKTLKLPDPIRKRVSMFGGVAGAALNSGLLNQE